MTEHGADARQALRLRQTIEVEAEQVQRMIADHYAALGLRFHHDHVNLKVHGSSGGGFSSTRAGFDGAVIHLHGQLAKDAEAAGMPTTLQMTKDAAANIVARRVAAAMEIDIPAGAITWDVLDAGGSGYGSHSAKLNRARVALSINA